MWSKEVTLPYIQAVANDVLGRSKLSGSLGDEFRAQVVAQTVASAIFEAYQLSGARWEKLRVPLAADLAEGDHETPTFAEQLYALRELLLRWGVSPQGASCGVRGVAVNVIRVTSRGFNSLDEYRNSLRRMPPSKYAQINGKGKHIKPLIPYERDGKH